MHRDIMTSALGATLSCAKSTLRLTTCAAHNVKPTLGPKGCSSDGKPVIRPTTYSTVASWPWTVSSTRKRGHQINSWSRKDTQNTPCCLSPADDIMLHGDFFCLLGFSINLDRRQFFLKEEMFSLPLVLLMWWKEGDLEMPTTSYLLH